MLSVEDMARIAQSKVETLVEEIYEMMKAESKDYGELFRTIARFANNIGYKDSGLGGILRIYLINKAKEDIADIPLKDGRKILYLCDGMVPECSKTHCYKNTDEDPCRHTSDINHAVNFMEEEKEGEKSRNIKTKQKNGEKRMLFEKKET